MIGLKHAVAVLTILLMLLCVSATAHAKLIENLYSATVDVASQSQQHRQQAIVAAFEQVLLKVTGQPETLDHPAIRAASSDVSQLLVQYGYQRNGSQTQLTATFDGRKLREILAQNELPYWGSRRPQLLLWMVQDSEGRRRLLGSSDESVFVQQLKDYAEQYAIPIQLPLLDLTDAMQVGVTDVWGRFIQPVATASKRYAADGFAIVRITENQQAADSDKRVQLDWTVDVDSQRLSGVVFASSVDWIAEPFVRDLSQHLAAQFSITNSDQQQLINVPLRVAGLRQWQDVLTLEAFLTSIPSVTDVQLNHYSIEQSRFTVVVRGSEENLLQSIQLDGRLRSAKASPFAKPDVTEEVVYQWLEQP